VREEVRENIKDGLKRKGRKDERSHAAINAAMADTSGITADSLKNKLTEALQAQHVEVAAWERAVRENEARWILLWGRRR
jgi:hypothetical protein